MPAFVLFFVGMAILRTMGFFPEVTLHMADRFVLGAGDRTLDLAAVLGQAGKWVITAAIAGIGLITEFRALRTGGLRPMAALPAGYRDDRAAGPGLRFLALKLNHRSRLIDTGRCPLSRLLWTPTFSSRYRSRNQSRRHPGRALPARWSPASSRPVAASRMRSAALRRGCPTRSDR